jgi:hypothetical protein
MSAAGDTRKLERIEEALIHARTAEIPIMVEDQGKMKRAIRAVVLGLALTILAHAREAWGWVSELLQ